MKKTKIIFDHFAGAADSYYQGYCGADGKTKYTWINKKLTQTLVDDPAITVGAAALDKNNDVKAIVFDVDNHGDQGNLDEVRGVTIGIAFHLEKEHGLKSHIVFSGHKGYHVWVLLDKKIPAGVAVAFGKEFIENHYPKTDTYEVELFPKQSVRPTGGKPGNCIKLPLQMHPSANVLSYFVDEQTLQKEDFTEPRLNDRNLIKATTTSIRKHVPLEESGGEMNCDPTASIASILAGCDKLRDIAEGRGELEGSEGHNNRIFFGNIMKHLGSEGLDKVHEVLSSYATDYQSYITETKLRTLTYKPQKCAKADCALYVNDMPCNKLQALAKRKGRATQYKSPIAFAVPVAKPVKEQIPDNRILQRDDIGNLKMFLSRYGDKIHSVDGKGWVVWDGKRWCSAGDDGLRGIESYVNDMAAHMLEITKDDIGSLDRKWAEGFGNITRQNALYTKLKRSAQLGVSNPGAVFDRHPNLLNVNNGIIDLTDGTLLPHDPKYKLTKIVDVDYKPDAEAPEWMAMLGRIVGNGDVADFLQLCAGYSLTDCITEQIFIILHGVGQSGKSSFVKGLATMTGGDEETSYFAGLRSSYLTKGSSKAGGHDDALASLAGRRLVNMNEVDPNAKFDEQTLRSITGGSSMSVSFKGKSTFNFKPTFKLWIDSNDIPTIIEEGKGTTSRRLVIFPFNKKQPRIEGFDIDVLVAKEAEGILAWGVRGAIEWYSKGGQYICIDSNHPAACQRAKKEFLGEMDRMLMFLSECCVVTNDDSDWMSTKDLLVYYNHWALEDNNFTKLNASSIGKKLSNRDDYPGITKKRVNNARGFCGFYIKLSYRKEVDESRSHLRG